MRALAIAIAAAAVLVSGSFHAFASPHPAATPSKFTLSLLLPSGHTGLANLAVRQVTVPMATSTTATPGATATATSAATPTPSPTTGPSYPDAATILQNMSTVLDALNTVHFEQIADQQGPVNLHVDALGDATCSGPALEAHVTASATVAGTQQKQSTKFYVIQVKNSYFQKSKKTKNRWQPAKAKAVQPFGFSVDNPLPCPNAATTGTGGGSTGVTDQIKDLVNVGPATVSGVSVWHIHATDVQVDSAGNTSELPLDWYISQDHSLLYSFVLSFSDSAQGVKGSLTSKFSKYGEKVKIKKPKKGASKP
jgi:hypothetical protein